MNNRLSKEQIEDLLEYCGTSPTFWRDDDMLVCCPVHSETNPSCGVSFDKQVFHCFSCGASGDFARMLLLSKPDEFGYDNTTKELEIKTWYKSIRKARRFLKDRYELEYRELYDNNRYIKKFDDLHKGFLLEEKEIVLPLWKIAPFQSGKKTYKYFFDRGFTIDDMRKFMIGYDEDNKTITIPVFNRENKLVGVVGRYISKNRKKNERYKIYNNFERSNYLYPENHLKVKDKTIILVEGQLDAIRMHSFGYINTLALMTDSISKKQVVFLENNCEKVIYVGDNDERGLVSRNAVYNKLKNMVDFHVVDFPNHGKDVCDWSKEEIDSMLKNSYSILKRKIKRR